MATPAIKIPSERETLRQALRMRRSWPSFGGVHAPSFARALRQHALLTAPEAATYRRRAAGGWVDAGR